MSIRPHISEAEAERLADRIVQRRLNADPRYVHAANGYAADAAEDAIEGEVRKYISERYVIDYD